MSIRSFLAWLVGAFVLLGAGVPIANAQHPHQQHPWAAAAADEVQMVLDGTVEVRPSAAPEHICELEPTFNDTGFFLQPNDARLHSGTAGPREDEQSALDTPIPTASLDVTYVSDCSGQPWPDEAMDAFAFAAEIWEQHVESEVPIRVRAVWSNFGDRPDAENLLGSAGPTRIVRFNEGDGVLADTWYPVAMASAITGQNIVDDIEGESFDIVANLSCEQPRWHFDTSRVPPARRIDFATVVLHEIGHGLGFTGSMSVPIDENREVEEETGSWGLTPQGATDPLPLVYDRFTTDGNANNLIDTIIYENPSEALYAALTGRAAGVFFDGPNATVTNQDANNPDVVGAAPPLFSPDPWRAGSSYAHVDQATYTGTTNALMRPSVSTGESVHSPGPVFCGILSDMGWPVGEGCTPFFPAGLANLSASVGTGDVTVSWEAEDGLTNYRVDVAALEGLGRPTFSPRATVEAPPFEVTLPDQPGGTYVVRVVPQDAPERRRSTSFTVGLEDALVVRGPAPSPFQDVVRVSFTVQQTQPVSVYVYNAAGQRVATLFDGQATAGQPIERALDDPRLSSGVYYFRFYGEEFDITETAVRVR
ncbi:MAG: hypothetical protein GVY15_09500 [Bacteroidetes bacterium]|jgi:hypothetical protein|nr:hypothetical protein [Bacteroidota bacterium]